MFLVKIALKQLFQVEVFFANFTNSLHLQIIFFSREKNQQVRTIFG